MKFWKRVLGVASWVLSWAAQPAGSQTPNVDIVSVDGNTYEIVRQIDGTRFVALVPAGGTNRFDIVVIGDGYTLADQARLLNSAKQFAEKLMSIPPFSESTCAVNIWLIQLVSADSGIDDPVAGVQRSTALDGRFANPGEGGMLVTASFEKCLQVWQASMLPDYDLIYVIVNDVDRHDGSWADASNPLACSSDMYPWGTVIAHEIGHVLANLADEYRCSKCDGSWEGSGIYPFSTVLHPNLSTKPERDQLPWADMIVESTSLPTTTDNAWSGSQIGAWEGGGYYKKGIYRPQEYCIMDGVTREVEPFCVVCEKEIHRLLQSHCGS